MGCDLQKMSFTDKVKLLHEQISALDYTQFVKLLAGSADLQQLFLKIDNFNLKEYELTDEDRALMDTVKNKLDFDETQFQNILKNLSTLQAILGKVDGLKFEDLVNVPTLEIGKIPKINNNASGIVFVEPENAQNVDFSGILGEVNNNAKLKTALEQRILIVSSLKDILNTSTENKIVYVKAYHEETNKNGGIFIWDSISTLQHNGIDVISPNATFPTDWNNDTQKDEWFNYNDNNQGRWIREKKEKKYIDLPKNILEKFPVLVNKRITFSGQVNLDVSSFRPTRTNTYFVDNVTGDDANDGSKDNPFKTIHKAILMDGDNEIIISAGKYYYQDAWKGVNSNKGISIIGLLGDIIISNEVYPRYWEAIGNGAYKTPTVFNGETLDNSSLRFVYDRKTSGKSTGAVGYDIPNKTTDQITRDTDPLIGKSIETDFTYIRLPNNDNPNENLFCYYAAENVICKIDDTNSDHVIYIENIKVVGGGIQNGNIELSNSTTGSKIYLKNVKSYKARSNGFSIWGNGLTITQDCESYFSYKDGMNYQTNYAVSGINEHHIIEINAKTRMCGLFDGDDRQNGSTAHGGCQIVRIKCDHSYNADRNIQDANTGVSVNIAVRTTGSRNNRPNLVFGLRDSNEYCTGYCYGCTSPIVESTDTAIVYVDECFFDKQIIYNTGVFRPMEWVI